MADGVAHAHGRGVVHRDIKPDNVLLSGRHALLADLGISKAVSVTTGGQRLTTVGVVLGTPEYMAPEQVAADPEVDHRADIYALGTLAYEMLAGSTPFGGRPPHAVLSAHVIEDPVPLAEERAELPDGLGELVMKCLKKEPSDRWQSAEDMVQELGLLVRGATTSGAARPSLATTVHGSRRLAVGAFLVTLLVVTGVLLRPQARTRRSGTAQPNRGAPLRQPERCR